MATASTGIVEQLVSLFSYEGIVGIGQGILGSPLAVVLILALIVRSCASAPVKEIEGSLVRAINSVEEWNAVMTESKTSGKFIVADFYATWCPPCKTAAPHFGRMSIEYGESNIIFCKIDVDKSKVAQSMGITSMPSFKIIKDAVEVNGMVGWSEAGLRAMLEKSGCSKSTSSSSPLAPQETKTAGKKD